MNVSKKVIAGIMTVAFILIGAAGLFIAEASPPTRKPPISPAEIAVKMAKTYGISSVTVLKHYSAGVPLRDINKAAFLATAGAKSLDEVLAAKKPDNTWKDVALSLGITKEQMKSTRYKIVAQRLNDRLQLDPTLTTGLLQQGYKPRDIAVSGILARDTNKSAAEILNMKKINNTWLEVANSLGIDQDNFRKKMQDLGFPQHRYHKHMARKIRQ